MPTVIKKTKSKASECEIDIPTTLSAKQFVAWAGMDDDTLPEDVQALIPTMQAAYKRLVLTNSVLVDGVALTQANFAKLNFPAGLAYDIIEATGELIDETVSKKKLAGE